MTTPIGAVAPIAGVLIDRPAAEPAEVHGGPANPAHGAYTWVDPAPVPWVFLPDDQAGSADFDQSLIGDTEPVMSAGTDPLLIAQPTETGSHAAPWPSFGTADGAVNDRDAAADRIAANAELHSLDTGGVAAFTHRPGTNPTTKMPWESEADYVSAGSALLEPVPGQLQGQMGRDRIQGTPALNSYGFDSAHVHRPRAVGDVPGNFLWLDGREQRPMTIQIAGRQTYPTGSDSPFQGQQAGVGAVDGAVLTGLPTPYDGPVQPPNLAAAPEPAEPVWSTW